MKERAKRRCCLLHTSDLLWSTTVKTSKMTPSSDSAFKVCSVTLVICQDRTLTCPDIGRTNERIGRIQETYVAEATSSWLESLDRSMVQMKEYQVG